MERKKHNDLMYYEIDKDIWLDENIMADGLGITVKELYEVYNKKQKELTKYIKRIKENNKTILLFNETSIAGICWFFETQLALNFQIKTLELIHEIRTKRYEPLDIMIYQLTEIKRLKKDTKENNDKIKALEDGSENNLKKWIGFERDLGDNIDNHIETKREYIDSIVLMREFICREWLYENHDKNYDDRKYDGFIKSLTTEFFYTILHEWLKNGCENWKGKKIPLFKEGSKYAVFGVKQSKTLQEKYWKYFFEQCDNKWWEKHPNHDRLLF